MNAYQELLDGQRAFFNSNATKSVSFRKEQMKKLLQLLKDNEAELDKAIYADFKKSSFENYATELSMIYSELKHSIKKVKYWSQKKWVATNLANFPGSSYIIPEPLGNTLVIGAWNYPYLLSLHPAISAIAAGNTVILKPSELAMNTSNLMAKLINENFDSNYFHVIEGGVKETTELLEQKFDKIFYTGSSSVGKIIMRAASEHLTPVVLELGGKSPAIITKGASIKMATKRLVWGKFLNGGQTCVAPDYLMVDKSIKAQLIEEIKKQITAIHGDDPQKSEAFVRIINPRHFKRLTQLIDQNKVIVGGNTDEQNLYIAPTLMDKVNWDDAVMKEEIFGPILPILEYDDLDDAIAQIKAQAKPLALYLFTNKKSIRDKVFHEISFGGGALNETIMHLANPNLPFGGVGNSGTGSYHGEYGFAAFSHQKSIIQKTTWFEPFIKYAPYNSFKLNILKKMM
ncbi:MAG: aldehyde dehydrogenase family protein [Bacteroidales bacterium]|nr:aldehyde dehydrogenase family protein [Bacteroidales bacterium]